MLNTYFQPLPDYHHAFVWYITFCRPKGSPMIYVRGAEICPAGVSNLPCPPMRGRKKIYPPEEGYKNFCPPQNLRLPPPPNVNYCTSLNLSNSVSESPGGGGKSPLKLGTEIGWWNCEDTRGWGNLSLKSLPGSIIFWPKINIWVTNCSWNSFHGHVLWKSEIDDPHQRESIHIKVTGSVYWTKNHI